MPDRSEIMRRRDLGLGDLCSRAAANNARAAELLQRLLGALPDADGLADEIGRCEHDGDEITHELYTRTNRSDLGSAQRRDILRLGSSLDDIVDYIEEVSDYLGLYRIEAPMEQALDLAAILVDATLALARGVDAIGSDGEVGPHASEVRRLENAGDQILRGALAALFETGIDPIVVICWKDIFERLENALDATERAANTLDSLSVRS